MPRLDDEGHSLVGATSRSTPSSDPILAKMPNQTPHITPLDQNGDNPQQMAPRNQRFARQRDATPSSSATNPADSPSLLVSPPLRVASPINGGANANLPDVPPGKPALTSEILAEDVVNLTKLLESVPSQAAGKVLKMFWRKFLFSENDSDHLSWILRAGIKNAPLSVIERIMRDQTTLNILTPVVSKQTVVIKAVLNDTTYDQLLSHIPNNVLDQEISKRVNTMPAKMLIRWLAEAERLGFRENDIISDEDETVVPNPATIESGIPTSVVPSAHFQNSAIPDSRISEPASGHLAIDYKSEPDVEMRDGARDIGNASRDSLHGVQGHNAATVDHQQQHATAIIPNGISSIPLMCPVCHFVFSKNSGYNYHLTKKICARQPPLKGYKFRCHNCGQSFTTKQGYLYHEKNNVCYDQGTAPATAPSDQGLPQQIPSITAAPQRKAADPILPPPRPTFSTYHQAQNGESLPQSGLQSGGPPLRTPISNQSRPSSVNISSPFGSQETTSYKSRQSPSELDPYELALLNKALDDQERKYHTKCAAIDPNMGPVERAARLQTLKNGHATKKSQIRKSFNVTLRMGEKDKAARNATMATPIPRPSLQGYRANLDGRPHAGEMVPAQSSSFNTPPSRFSPINTSLNNGYDRQGSQSMSHAAGNGVGGSRPDITSSSEHLLHAEKRQRTNSYPAAPNQPQGQSLAGAGDRSSSQNGGSTEAHGNEMGHVVTNKLPTRDPQVVLGGMMKPIEVLTSSEDEDMPSITDRTTSDTQRDTTTSIMEKALDKRRSEGPIRSTFTAKRGRPYSQR